MTDREIAVATILVLGLAWVTFLGAWHSFGKFTRRNEAASRRIIDVEIRTQESNGKTRTDLVRCLEEMRAIHADVLAARPPSPPTKRSA